MLPFEPDLSIYIPNVSQWKTTSAPFINTRSLMSLPLLNNHQLKIVAIAQITI